MKKKIALVTGASSGIGKSVSIFLAENDYFVILLARNEERLKNVKDQSVTISSYDDCHSKG